MFKVSYKGIEGKMEEPACGHVFRWINSFYLFLLIFVSVEGRPVIVSTKLYLILIIRFLKFVFL